jgi:hypothetical protein
MTIWNILRTFGIFYDHLVHFVVFIWYILLCSFGTFFPVWVSCTEKNLATLFLTAKAMCTLSYSQIRPRNSPMGKRVFRFFRQRNAVRPKCPLVLANFYFIVILFTNIYIIMRILDMSFYIYTYVHIILELCKSTKCLVQHLTPNCISVARPQKRNKQTKAAVSH